jgi:ferrous iron transport protein B
MPTAPPIHRPTVIVGKESTGKSELAAALTGRSPTSTNIQGSTIACETYQTRDDALIDTPGILFRSDTATTRTALARLQAHDRILLVVKATHMDEDLTDLLPLVAGKQGLVVVTFWDKVLPSDFTQQVLGRWEQAAQVRFIPVDARHLSSEQRQQIFEELQTPAPFPQQWHPIPAGWRIEPAPTWLEHPRWGGLLAILLLLLPAVIAVWVANGVAGLLDPLIQTGLAPLINVLAQAPSLLEAILIGRYGLVTMGPLLFVWAVPTVILYALFLDAYKASGLVEHYRGAASIAETVWPVRARFGAGDYGIWLQCARRDQHSRLFQLFPADLRECDRLWFGLFLPVWGHPGGLQRGQFARFSGALPGLPNPDHPDLHPLDCAQSRPFSP